MKLVTAIVKPHRIDDVKDAANTFAVFLRGPEGVRVEYVEHKPGFALV